MIDQVITWFHANGQFVATVIAILTPLLPTVIVKAINDKKLVNTLKNIRNSEDLKRLAQDLLNEKVTMLQGQITQLLKQQNIGEVLTKALADTQDTIIALSKKVNDNIDSNLDVINQTLNNLNRLIPDLKKEFYMIVGGQGD